MSQQSQNDQNLDDDTENIAGIPELEPEYDDDLDNHDHTSQEKQFNATKIRDRFSRPHAPTRGTRIEMFMSSQIPTPLDPVSAERNLRDRVSGLDVPESVKEFLVNSQLESAKLVQEAVHRLNQVEALAQSTINSQGTTAVSSNFDYVFEPEVLEELERHPKDHSHLSSEDFKSQIRAIPFVKKQVIKTQIRKDEQHLLERLSSVDSERILKWIPKAEGLWSHQLRIAAYLHDICVKVSKMPDYVEIVTELPWIEDLVTLSRFSFVGCLGARRRLATEKLDTISKSIGVSPVEHDESDQHAQYPSAFGSSADEITHMARSAKRQRLLHDTLHQSQTPSKRVFGRGRSRGQTPSGRFQTPRTHRFQNVGQRFAPREFNNRSRGRSAWNQRRPYNHTNTTYPQRGRGRYTTQQPAGTGRGASIPPN
jgi:hypothetical protein